MRLTVERDGRRTEVEVASDLASVEVDGRSFPVKVVAVAPTRVELEIDGERVLVEGWPEGFAEPPGPVDVGGERWPVRVERGPGPSRSMPAPAPPPVVAESPRSSSPPVAGAVAVLPPMPGKVVDVRVRDGDRVRKGDVLLRVEAMKMVNEIPSPADGRVRDVRVAAGANVRAREPMLWVDPAPEP